MFCWSPAADQATGAGSLTILRLLVDAWSRSIAAASSLGGASVDQRLPTRRTSPRPSRSRSRASAFSLLSPAAREAIAVENELGSPSSAARRRSGRRVVSRSLACGCGAGSSATAHTASAEAGSRPTGGSSPKRARQPAHKTTGSRPAGRTISNPRHFRAERHTPQRRPARSICLTSSVPIGISLQDRTSNRGVSLALRRPDGPKWSLGSSLPTISAALSSSTATSPFAGVRCWIGERTRPEARFGPASPASAARRPGPRRCSSSLDWRASLIPDRYFHRISTNRVPGMLCQRP